MDLGIYVHIPFCKQFCYYCDFYKSANYRFLPEFLDAIKLEIEHSFNDKDRFLNKKLQEIELKSIYFGGGTPSSIGIRNLEKILHSIQSAYSVETFEDMEVTIEVNPEDVDLDFYEALRSIGFNRLSIGIQSFNDQINHFLHRRHSVQRSKDSIENARKAGFSNISIDLIYGIPGQSLKDFNKDLDLFFGYHLNHLSAYHLSIEEGTEFGRRKRKNLLTEIEDQKSNQFYELLIREMRNHSFEHYEISNFSLKGYNALHNSSYWSGKAYLGFGPAAHSFNGMNKRKANVSSVKDYNYNVLHDLPYSKLEFLNIYNRYNEFIINGLRTKYGFNFSHFKDLVYRAGSPIDNIWPQLVQFFDSSLQELKKFHADAFRSFHPFLCLKEEYLLIADYYIEKLIIDADEYSFCE